MTVRTPVPRPTRSVWDLGPIPAQDPGPPGTTILATLVVTVCLLPGLLGALGLPMGYGDGTSGRLDASGRVLHTLLEGSTFLMTLLAAVAGWAVTRRTGRSSPALVGSALGGAGILAALHALAGEGIGIDPERLLPTWTTASLFRALALILAALLGAVCHRCQPGAAVRVRVFTCIGLAAALGLAIASNTPAAGTPLLGSTLARWGDVACLLLLAIAALAFLQLHDRRHPTVFTRWTLWSFPLLAAAAAYPAAGAVPPCTGAADVAHLFTTLASAVAMTGLLWEWTTAREAAPTPTRPGLQVESEANPQIEGDPQIEAALEALDPQVGSQRPDPTTAGPEGNMEESPMDAAHEATREETCQLRSCLEAAEAEARRLQAQLEASRKVSATDRRRAALGAPLVSSMGQSLRTPLNGILGMTHMLLETELDDGQREFVTTIQESGSELLSLINDVLDVVRIEAGLMDPEPVEFEPTALAEKVTALFENTARERKLYFNIDVADDVPSQLVGDARRLRQILLNLVGHAVDATSTGGVQVRFAADLIVGDPRLRVEVQRTGVTDGEDCENLFERVRGSDSITRRYGGSGLGLALCKRLVAMMGGEIDVQSQQGRGTRYWLTVPLRVPELPALEAPAQAAAPRSTNLEDEGPLDGLRILLVEDNLAQQREIHNMLEKMGLRTTAVESGGEALDFVGQEEFEIILLDCVLPGIDGFEVARVLRARPGTQSPILGMAETVDDALRAQGRDAGMVEVLAQPLQAEELEPCLLRVCGLPQA